MKYQNNFLDNKGNQPSKFRMKNWDRINNDSRGTYNTNSQTKFKTTMFKSSLCHFSGSYILVSRSTTVPNTGTTAAPNNRKYKIFRNCSSVTTA